MSNYPSKNEVTKMHQYSSSLIIFWQFDQAGVKQKRDSCPIYSYFPGD